MLKAIGYLWPILAIVLIGFTMWIVVDNPVPMVANEKGVLIQAVGVPTRADLWIRALPLQTTFVLSMAGIRWSAVPLKNAVAAMQTKANK